MLVILLILCAVLATVNEVSCESRVKNLVVLEMENHSFDNMLGWLKRKNPEIDGLTGKECNMADPNDPTSKTFCVTDKGALVDPDPGHTVPDTAHQIYGKKEITSDMENDPNSINMSGFIATESTHGEAGTKFAEHIMDCIPPEHAPIINTLADEFAIFDKFYSGIPGPTFPNRLFSMSASSEGYVTNDKNKTIQGWTQKSIFDSLNDANIDWKIYFHDAQINIEI